MNLLDRINDRQFSVAVVGLGYVGLPLAVEFASKGITTHGIDVDPRKVESLCAGKNYIQDISDDIVRDVLDRGVLRATSDFSVVA